MWQSISEHTAWQTMKQMGYSSSRPHRLPLLSAKMGWGVCVSCVKMSAMKSLYPSMWRCPGETCDNQTSHKTGYCDISHLNVQKKEKEKLLTLLWERGFFNSAFSFLSSKICFFKTSFSLRSSESCLLNTVSQCERCCCSLGFIYTTMEQQNTDTEVTCSLYLWVPSDAFPVQQSYAWGVLWFFPSASAEKLQSRKGDLT